MLNFIRNFKISTQLMVISSMLIALVIFSISLLATQKVQQLSSAHASSTANSITNRCVGLIQTYLDTALGQTETIAKVFETLLNQKNAHFTRLEANQVLKEFIAKHPDYLGITAFFEPNAFDGKDEEYANTFGHDGTGRFVPYWISHGDDAETVEPAEGYDTALWYTLPKQLKHTTITEPYTYSIAGKEVWLVTVSAPILNEKQEFLGGIAIDLSLESFNDLLNAIKIDNFVQAYTSVYSHKGTIITAPDVLFLGKDVMSVNGDKDYTNRLLSHKDFDMIRKSASTESLVWSYAVNLAIGKTGNVWTIAVNIPVSSIEHESQQIKIEILITGVIIIAIMMLLLYWMTTQTLNPLIQVNRHLKFLAMGKILTEDNFTYHGKDEIADLVEYAHQLKSSMIQTIQSAKLIASGDYGQEIQLLSEDDQLGSALNKMQRSLGEANVQMHSQDWLKSGMAELNNKVSGEQELVPLSENMINFLTLYVEGQVGAFYILQQEESAHSYLKMLASHAYTWRKHASHEFKIGEGLVGQAALERKPFVITQLPDEYMYIQTGLGGASPNSLCVSPFLYENQLLGVIEIAKLTAFTPLQLEFLNQAMKIVAVAINTAKSRTMMQALLEQTQMQAGEMQQQASKLQMQQQELQQSNEELQTQAEELQTQQEELRQANETLQARTLELERQKDSIREKNLSLEKAQLAIENKARELELASKYKSEFLANMSHELRTPLNSMLILAQLLAKNSSQNLTEKQIEYAQTIQSSGSDLLMLINDILDLSKVEAGKVEVHLENCALAELLDTFKQKFQHLANQQGLDFQVNLAGDLPTSIRTDSHRLKQIINNLLSNAFKFTAQGSVILQAKRATPAELTTHHLPVQQSFVYLSVRDSGIGIPSNKQQLIFEAFQQADGTTSRKYGGTGLGLAISRQLARLLGGDIKLVSDEGKGSTFILFLPEQTAGNTEAIIDHPTANVAPKNTISTIEKRPVVAPPLLMSMATENTAEITPVAATTPTESNNIVVVDESVTTTLADDRMNLVNGDKILLVIEDDQRFADVLIDLAREKGFKCLYAGDGKMGLQLVESYLPDAIILDVGLPKIDGLTVLEKLKDNPDTRHIPVHFISGTDQSHDARRLGALGYLLKPVSMNELSDTFEKLRAFISRQFKKLLLMSDNAKQQNLIVQVVGSDTTEVILATTLSDAQQFLRVAYFDAIVIDIDTQAEQSFNLLEFLVKDDLLARIPVILYGNRGLTIAEEQQLQQFEDNLVVKTVASPERLLDEATLFMHQVAANLSSDKQTMLMKVHDKEAILAHKKIMIVDDDMRNTYALMTALEEKEMEIIIANNGKEALTVLKTTMVDLILMDIMMPEMDGYETMREIRGQVRLNKIPIIALTAKAMKDDKAKCIEAGANDYLSKPIEVDRLLSLMRVWLYR